MGAPLIFSNPPKVALIGGGFIGPVHAEALRRIGVPVHRRARADPGTGPARRPSGSAPRRFTSTIDELLSRPGGRLGPHRLAEPGPLRAGQAGPGGRQARPLREAAGRHLEGDGRAGQALGVEAEAGRGRQLQRPVLPALPRDEGPGRPRRHRQAPVGHRLVHARTGCCCRPTTTGASSPTGPRTSAPSPTSARTGWTWPSSSPARRSSACWPTSAPSTPSAASRSAAPRRSPAPPRPSGRPSRSRSSPRTTARCSCG